MSTPPVMIIPPNSTPAQPAQSLASNTNPPEMTNPLMSAQSVQPICPKVKFNGRTYNVIVQNSSNNLIAQNPGTIDPFAKLVGITLKYGLAALQAKISKILKEDDFTIKSLSSVKIIQKTPQDNDTSGEVILEYVHKGETYNFEIDNDLAIPEGDSDLKQLNHTPGLDTAKKTYEKAFAILNSTTLVPSETFKPNPFIINIINFAELPDKIRRDLKKSSEDDKTEDLQTSDKTSEIEEKGKDKITSEKPPASHTLNPKEPKKRSHAPQTNLPVLPVIESICGRPATSSSSDKLPLSNPLNQQSSEKQASNPKEPEISTQFSSATPSSEEAIIKESNSLELNKYEIAAFQNTLINQKNTPNTPKIPKISHMEGQKGWWEGYLLTGVLPKVKTDGNGGNGFSPKSTIKFETQKAVELLNNLANYSWSCLRLDRSLSAFKELTFLKRLLVLLTNQEANNIQVNESLETIALGLGISNDVVTKLKGNTTLATELDRLIKIYILPKNRYSQLEV
ncbi:MAG: hypothetical protein WCT85_01850 [Parachlamydiales bacterium]|jgi:hypothetical protein